MNTFRKILLLVYFSIRNSWPVWYGILNRDARARYTNAKPILNAVQTRIAEDLSRDGIAFATIDELFPGEDLLSKLKADMDARGQVGDTLRKKTFLRPYWEDSSAFDLSNPFFALSLRPELLAIANTYDRMFRRLNYIHLTETVPVGDSTASFSQRWHRDPEEKRMVKFFLYLNDVDEEAGPFTYVKGSQFGSPMYGSLFKQKLPLGIYPPDGAVEKSVNATDIVVATGKAGTVIFCDTAGLHRGGHAKSKSRFMFTAFYPSDKWTEKTHYKVADTLKKTELSTAAQYAISAI